MSAVPYQSHEPDWEATEEEPSLASRRPRRRFFNRRSAALAAVVTCAAGFFAGVRVEKSQFSGTASAATTTAAGRFGGGAGAGGGNASIGTISSVNGNTIYLTDTTGNTVKVTLSGTTKLAKSLDVSKRSLHPGDTVVVQGVKNSSGTLVATSISDSGARTAGAASAGGTSASGG
jgi:Domain of unknown function (DUF5666)